MESLTLNTKAAGYRGIWYMNQKSHDEYVYKYSGGLGTYCAKHRPFAVYSPEARKTFFCFGGTSPGSYHAYDGTDSPDRLAGTCDGMLLHMVSYYDHETGLVPRPTVLLDKHTYDAHDNPVISLDEAGFIWIFSTSHGTSRPSYIHRSIEPFSIDAFERIEAVYEQDGHDVPLNNFSYFQPAYVRGKGFACFFTHYGDPADRTLFFMHSANGRRWSRWTRLAAIQRGHYQISEISSDRAGTAFNFHPREHGLNWRTNLYYLETRDLGSTWRNAAGDPIELPLTDVRNPALVHDYESEGLRVYLKDIVHDGDGLPVILYVTSRGYECGPKNDPRTWTTARWTGAEWDIRPGMVSDNNYDTGALHIEPDGTWRIIGPTETGPQPYNPGGEMAMWISADRGATWTRARRMTRGSERNHTYARRPVNAHPDFYALWADGNARAPSDSWLYFADRDGNVRLLPPEMDGAFAEPRVVYE